MHTQTLPMVLALSLFGCAPEDPDPQDTDEIIDDSDTSVDDTDAVVDNRDVYEFVSRNGTDSSVAYTGQVFRQLLIDEMVGYISGLTERIDTDAITPVAGDIEAGLDFYFRFDSSTSGDVPLATTPDPAAIQTTWNDISTDKDIVGKLAGNDPATDHKDWSTELVGWPGASSPQGLVEGWFAELDALAADRANNVIPTDPDGNPLPHVYLTADGLDLKQLIDKFVRGAVTISQGLDDYLDDDTEGKGLLADHSALSEGAAYTALEHQWDEGFGYFGAARDFPSWTLDQIASGGPVDTFDPDGQTDLTAEMCYGHSTNAAKRDRGALVATDFVGEAWEGFYEGRTLLASTTEALTPAQLDELKGHRDKAAGAWEKAVAATAVHYINDTLQDMGKFGTDDYSFADHAKHWGELKGFALVLQFSPFSPLTDPQFADLHDLLGTAPVLADATTQAQDDYKDDLLDARSLLGTAYGFDLANLGDDDGTNGW